MNGDKQVDQRWVWRPDPASPARPVYGIEAAGADGRVEVVLNDGTRIQASPAELRAE
jgi:hypothetical protein